MYLTLHEARLAVAEMLTRNETGAVALARGLAAAAPKPGVLTLAAAVLANSTVPWAEVTRRSRLFANSVTV